MGGVRICLEETKKQNLKVQKVHHKAQQRVVQTAQKAAVLKAIVLKKMEHPAKPTHRKLF